MVQAAKDWWDKTVQAVKEGVDKAVQAVKEFVDKAVRGREGTARASSSRPARTWSTV